MAHLARPVYFIALARTPVRVLLCAPHFRPAWWATDHANYFENGLLRCVLPAQSPSSNLDRGFGPFFASHFHACVVCAGEHDVYYENGRCRALTLTLSHAPRTEWERGPEALLRKRPSPTGSADRRHSDARHLARSALRAAYSSCVVSPCGHGVLIRKQPSPLRSAGPKPFT